MKVKQVVRVQILGAPREYTYAWFFMPGVTESLRVGDKVELPPNQVQEEGSSGTVSALGSDYSGPMKEIVRVIERPYQVYGYEMVNTGPDEVEFRRPDDEDLWGGMGQGAYE